MPALHGRLFVLVVSIAAVLVSASVAVAAPPYVYALRQVSGGANRIYGFGLDQATGELTALPGFPVATGGNGGVGRWREQLVFGGGRLFAVNDGSNTLSVFAVNQATGALTAMPFSPVALGSGFWGVVGVHPTGSPVLVGNVVGEGSLTSLVITPTAATAASGSPFAMGADSHPSSIAFSRDGYYVYAGGDYGHGIAGFSIFPSTGVLNALPGSPFNSGNRFPLAYATDNAGRLFVSNDYEGQVRVFTTSGGVPTGVTGNPFPSGRPAAARGVLHPAGYCMVAERDNHVGVYRISGAGAATTLAAVSGSPFVSSGQYTNTLALTPDGSLLVAGSAGSFSLTVFRVNANTGRLTSLLVQPRNTLGSTGFVTGLALVPAATVADFNADRNADLLWRSNTSGQNFAWLMNGAALSDFGYLPTIADTNWEVKGTGDLDANGRADLVWRNKVTGENIAWLMNGLTVSLSAFLPRIVDTNWDIEGVGDFDADGKADVIWHNTATAEYIAWLMNGATVAFSAFLRPTGNTNAAIVGVGDIDGNGRADVILRNNVTGRNSLWLMNGAAIAFAASLPTIADTNWEVKGVGDLNGNGTADVVWRNRVTGQNLGWQLGAAEVTAAAWLTADLDTNWEIKALRDVDGDSLADVIWRNRVTGQNRVWLMNGFAIRSTALLPTVAGFGWDLVGR